MFLHNFKYEFLSAIRQKDFLFWMMCFPIILGTFFNMAFGDLYEKDAVFTEIPVAVVGAENDETFRTVMDELSSGEDALFKPEYTDRETAMELLEDNEVRTIINAGGEKLTMSVVESGLENSIVKSFLDEYELQKSIITETAVNDPAKLEAVIAALASEVSSVESKAFTDGNMDPYVQYFHNLITMVAMFGMVSGLYIATSNQGNLSAIGARKCISPTHKLISIIASLLATYIAQIICTFVCITFILFVLKVNMGDQTLMIYLSGAIGALAGVTAGFFVGSFGRLTENAKNGIAFAVSMLCCFLSGLMVGTIKAIIEQYCPIINRINPAARISDLFYCLMIYDDHSRWLETAATIIIMSVIFTAGGFLLTRRKNYASI